MTLKWRQGSISCGYQERAVWTTKFDAAGGLREVAKKQLSHEAHGRRWRNHAAGPRRHES